MGYNTVQYKNNRNRLQYNAIQYNTIENNINRLQYNTIQ